MGQTRWYGGTHDVDELLHLTYTLRRNFAHLERYERTELISLHAFHSIKQTTPVYTQNDELWRQGFRESDAESRLSLGQGQTSRLCMPHATCQLLLAVLVERPRLGVGQLDTSRSYCNELTPCTRARTSPVDGHTLSSTSPLPDHLPS